MESLPNTSWSLPNTSWQLVGSENILYEATQMLNSTSEADYVLNDLSENAPYKNINVLQDKPIDGHALNREENVASLLQQWDVPELEEHFTKNKVDIKSLKYARLHQLPDLLQNIPWGIKVKFEHCLFEWQKQIGSYVEEDQNRYNTNISDAPENTVAFNYSDTSALNDQCTELIDLKEVLGNYNEGKTIMKLIDQNVKELPDTQRQIVVDKIVDYFIQNNKKMSVSLAKNITSQILCLFPDEIKEYYFAPQKNKAPKGKLLAKYYNNVRKLKSIGLMEVPLSKRRLSPDSPSVMPEAEEGAETMKEKLKYMKEEERWEDIRVLWKKCQNYRRQYLVEDESKNLTTIFNEWPLYRHPLGYTLIEIDFEYLFPNAGNMYSKWQLFANEVLEIFVNRIKEKKCLLLLEKLKTQRDISEDGRNVGILLLLHAAIVPTSKKTQRVGTKKILIKYTISDSQDAFMVTGASAAEVETKLLTLKNKNMPIQPHLVVIYDDNVLNPKQYLVCCDQIKYTFFSPISALNCCFQIFHTFNLNYPLECLAVWQFLQIYFFDIKTKHDVVLPNINMFMNELKKKNLG